MVKFLNFLAISSTTPELMFSTYVIDLNLYITIVRYYCSFTSRVCDVDRYSYLKIAILALKVSLQMFYL